MPLELMAVSLDFLLYLVPHSGLGVPSLHMLPVGIDDARPSRRYHLCDPVPINVSDAPLSQVLYKLGCLFLQGSGQT